MMVGAPLLPTAPATTTPSTPTIMAEPRAPVIADPPRSSLALDIDIGAFEAVGAEKNKTREVDTNEIAQILANDIARDPVPAPVATSSPTAEANKTREVDAKEIADLLARTRRDE